MNLLKFDDMNNTEKAKEIAESCYSKRTKDIPANRVGQLIIKQACLEMAKWKDKQLYLLLDSIDHAYLRTDGTYGELSYEVSDKVKFLKKQLKGE